MIAKNRFSNLLKIICFFLFAASPLSANQQISTYTNQKIKDFNSMIVEFYAHPTNPENMKRIESFKTDTFSKLEHNAIDYEQESLILENYIKLEQFALSFYSPSGRDLKQTRLMLKELMKKDENWLSKNGQDGANAFMYLVTADTTSCYMTFSMAATLLYGMRVKKLYEKALGADPNLTIANINLGQWLFYAPSMFGGSKTKAGNNFRDALSRAATDSDKYFAYIFYSQFCFENKDIQSASVFLEKAEEISPNDDFISKVKKLNENNTSLFAANRKRSGVDENTSQTEL